MERSKNAVRNIFVGFILKIYQLILPFIMRTVLIYCLGIEYLGLNSLFTSVLQVLSLAELGIGSAMVYSMYKPIAENDENTICALMNLYKIYYRIIGMIVAIIGCILLPFIPNLIKGDVPGGMNVYVLYLINLGATVLSYFLFAYKNSILAAHQRTDVGNKVLICTNTIKYAIQFVVLIFLKNYYLYLIVTLACQALTNIVTAICADKLYPKYQAKGVLDKQVVKKINSRIKDLFTAKLGMIIYDSADTIVISSFLGLTVLAIYQNYYYILYSVTTFITIIFNACTAGIGNSIVVETKEKNFNDLKKFTLIITWISGVCAAIMMNLYQPFMELWVGKDLILPIGAVICFVIYFFIRQINSLLNLYKDASGMWHEDRFRPLCTALFNLLLNIILVQYIGVYGVLLSTVIAILIVGMPWQIHNLFTVIFDKREMLKYVKKMLIYCIVVFITTLLSFILCSLITGDLIKVIILRAIVSVIVSNLVYLICFRKTNEFKEVLILGDRITKGKLNRFFGVFVR